MDANQQPQDAPVEIVAYDPSWPARFHEEREVLVHCLQAWLAGPIEHVGSTAVPGLAAKPVIDIMASSRSTLRAMRLPCSSRAATCTFRTAPTSCTGSASRRRHFEPTTCTWCRSPALWAERVAFRDYLRRHPDVAGEYGALKRELAARHAFDREAYTESNGPFVTRITALALGGVRP